MTTPEFAAHYAEHGGEVAARLQRIEDLVRELVPDMGTTVAYGIPTATLHGKNLVHWAGYAHHVGFYPGAATIAAFAGEFEHLTYAKGSVRFPNDEPLPMDLIARMIRHRRELG